jgi:hypothetical protein
MLHAAAVTKLKICVCLWLRKQVGPSVRDYNGAFIMSAVMTYRLKLLVEIN